MSHTAIYNEMLKLSACCEVAEAALHTAKAIRSIADGSVCAVFLLDYGNEMLILAASDCERGVSIKNTDIPASLLDDPLCFCMQTGRLCSVSLYPGVSSFLSADCVQNGCGKSLTWMSALPLTAPGKRTIGAVLLAGYTPSDFDSCELELYCLYSAAAIRSLIEHKNMKQRLDGLEKDLVRLCGSKPANPVRAHKTHLIGQSESLCKIRRQLEQIALSSAPVLLPGETGTGKGMAARFIHENSLRATYPFIEVNCGALSANLLESELFGHVKGAFTGADSEHQGLFRSAHKGTIFLDEIGELPINLQTVLLQVLQDKRVRPVGGIKTYDVDVRIISATNIDLLRAIEEGRFRRDLYHRITTVVVPMPPLSARMDDIPTLARHFLAEFQEQYKRPDLSLSQQALQHLVHRSYPGNIRELTGCIEAAVMLCEPGVKELLPEHFQAREAEPESKKLSLPDYLAQQEAAHIDSSMRIYGGNIQKSAEALGIPRRTLARKIEKYSIKKTGMEPDMAPSSEKEA